MSKYYRCERCGAEVRGDMSRCPICGLELKNDIQKPEYEDNSKNVSKNTTASDASFFLNKLPIVTVLLSSVIAFVLIGKAIQSNRGYTFYGQASYGSEADSTAIVSDVTDEDIEHGSHPETHETATSAELFTEEVESELHMGYDGLSEAAAEFVEESGSEVRTEAESVTQNLKNEYVVPIARTSEEDAEEKENQTNYQSNATTYHEKNNNIAITIAIFIAGIAMIGFMIGLLVMMFKWIWDSIVYIFTTPPINIIVIIIIIYATATYLLNQG